MTFFWIFAFLLVIGVALYQRVPLWASPYHQGVSNGGVPVTCESTDHVEELALIFSEMKAG